jgi:uncharacterized protein YndB with AHSA1/START domain
MNAGTDAGTRSIEMEITIDAPVEAVWEALSTGEGLEQWFPPTARVKPGEGGSVFLSWGAGVEGEGRIVVWEPNRRIAWREPFDADTPVRFLIDFELEAQRGGSTKLRLVHSGFGEGADWDEQYEATKAGWTYFLFNLAWYVVRHRGKLRRLISSRRSTTRPVAEVWKSLLARTGIDASKSGPGTSYTMRLDGVQNGQVEYVREPRNFAGTLTSLDDGLLFIELESGTPSWHCGVWVSVYGVKEERAAALQVALDEIMDAEFGVA